MPPSVGLSTYVTMKLFSVFRDRFLFIVNSYRKNEHDTSLYNHIFLAPESFSKKRSFQVKGVASPFVCMWATSPLRYNKQFYPRSVLPQDFLFELDGEQAVERGFLYDYEQSYELSASSFFADFRSEINQDLLDLDRLRYVSLNVDQLLPGYSCVAELMLSNMVQKENVDQVSGNRSFDLGAKYEVKITLPVLAKSFYADRVRVWLQDEMVWQKQVEEVEPEPS